MKFHFRLLFIKLSLLRIIIIEQFDCSNTWKLINNSSKIITDSYWKTVDVNSYQSDSDIDLTNYLLKYNRPIDNL